eukprot:TRINITY_DN6239_c0_g1_i1.p1 TRINITY_DN6239_c0_g1~~TRINITY_DN6239_c0_g1_i1.p1  ORF type:complete len:387 (-),score=75.99 TRINITY_DN6239_c0_g1_i1:706-1830(-)
MGSSKNKATCFRIDKKFLFLATALIMTGSTNTIAMKFSDIYPSIGIDGTRHLFVHPVVQSFILFCAMAADMIAYRVSVVIEKKKGTWKGDAQFNAAVFLLPTLCDVAATVLMLFALNWTYASIYSMMRGCSVIFTGLFSMIFLKQRLWAYHWAGMIIVMIGLAIVGLSSYLMHAAGNSAPRPLAGALLVAATQVIGAAQMVLEQKFLKQYNIPSLQAAGWEGVWGAAILLVLLVIFYFIPGLEGSVRLEDSLDAAVQIGNSWQIGVSMTVLFMSVAVFNYLHMAMIQYTNATTRTILDSIRPGVIWLFSLAIGWQKFFWIQPVGFAVIIFGNFVYNKVFKPKCLGKRFFGEHEDQQPLLPKPTDEQPKEMDAPV